MTKLDNIIRLTTMGGVALERLLLKRFLFGMVSILMLVFIISVLIAAFVVACLYLIFQLLMQSGMSTDAALGTVIGCTVAVIALFIALAVYRLLKLRKALTPRPHIISRINDMVEGIAEAFINGLLEKPSE